MSKLLFAVVAVAAVACGAPETQVLTGRVAPGFPSEITMVSITTTKIQSWHGNVVVATAPVAGDGTFRIEAQAVSGLHFHLLGDGTSRLVFPRQLGQIDRSFAIRGHGADFDLGLVSFVGTSSTTPIVFSMTGGGGESDCEDGHDSNGNMCVDDEDEQGDSCDDSDSDSEDGDHDDGDDEDGDHEDGGHEDDDDDGGGMGDAVAEHNFPADGCTGDEDDDEEED